MERIFLSPRRRDGGFMWAKFETVPLEGGIIFLPKGINIKFDKGIAVIFSSRTADAFIEYSNEDSEFDGSTYERPLIIKITTELRQNLLLPEALTFRIKLTESCMRIGPVIGLLLGIHTHRYNPFHLKKYSDRFGIYNEVGGLIYAFSPKSVNWERQTAYGLYYSTERAKWIYGCFPLPEVIYRRDFHSNPKFIEKLKNHTKGRLFNSYRFTKYELYDYIGKNEELKGFLPPTEISYNIEQVSSFIDRNTKVILKPVDLSRGRGICIIEKLNSRYKISDYRYKHPVTSVLNDKEGLENFFTLNQCFFNKYIIQKYLSLARIGASLFDIRVVMQKHPDKSWNCTGIECRVSGENGHITNISRGGYALTLDEALKRSFKKDYGELPERIVDFCRRFCLYMDEMNECFAEFGIDIAVDTDKNLWLIEANVFPSFKGFKSIDRKTYLAIRYTPMLYALSLTPFADDNQI